MLLFKARMTRFCACRAAPTKRKKRRYGLHLCSPPRGWPESFLSTAGPTCVVMHLLLTAFGMALAKCSALPPHSVEGVGKAALSSHLTARIVRAAGRVWCVKMPWPRTRSKFVPGSIASATICQSPLGGKDIVPFRPSQGFRYHCSFKGC